MKKGDKKPAPPMPKKLMPAFFKRRADEIRSKGGPAKPPAKMPKKGCK